MKYHALFVILKKQQNLKFLSAANCRWRLEIMGKHECPCEKSTYKMMVATKGQVSVQSYNLCNR